MNSEICREYIFEMEEVGIREFWAGINLKDSFLQFVRNGVNGFSTGIFMNEGLSARDSSVRGSRQGGPVAAKAGSAPDPGQAAGYV